MKKLVLIGGGHAHIQVLKAFGRLKKPIYQVTLVSDVQMAPYSGMLPGFMAGEYDQQELHFDLKKICDRYGFCFIQSKAVYFSQKQKQVGLENSEVIDFDVASIDIGIEPQNIITPANRQSQVIELKPISKLLDKWEKVLNQKVQKISIIGGGAAAFEVAIACRRRFSCQIQIFTSTQGLLKSMNLKTQELAKLSLKRMQIEVHSDQTITEIKTLDENEVCFVATSASPPVLFQNSDLPLTESGFVKVEDTLLVEGSDHIYASGDCCQITGYNLPKAGVFVVRQGPVLIHNLLNSKHRSYKPQKVFLSLLVTGDKRAILSYGSWAIEGRLFWYLKDWIDRRFMKRFGL